MPNDQHFFENEPHTPTSNVAETHRVSYNLKETIRNNQHLIATETRGYLCDDEILKKLVNIGVILPEFNPNTDTNPKRYEYVANGLTSLRGFLNGTKVDSRGPEKRVRVINKISNALDNLSYGRIAITHQRDVNYHDIALNDSSDPVLLPIGFKFSKTESLVEAEARNNIIGLQIASSILAVLGNADDTPFKGLMR